MGGRGVKEPVSITNANGGFPSGPFHEGPPSKLTNNAFSGLTKATSKETATIALIGVTTTAIAASTRPGRDVASGRAGGGEVAVVCDWGGKLCGRLTEE